MKILIADDDPVIRQMLAEILAGLGHETSEAPTAAATVEAARSGSFDLALLDLTFPDCTDLSTLEAVRRHAPATDVIMVTAQTEDLGLVAEATRLGAFDYVPKPIRDDDIRIRTTRVQQLRDLSRTSTRAVSQLARGSEIADIIGESPGVAEIVKQARTLSGYDVPVLINGETGTGKELVARALHYAGPRRARPFVSLNCAALAAGLIESELFGHERGSFTGAHQARQGAFEEAEDGTLFLDEVGDMSLQAQASLLHVLEHGEYRSVGGRPKRALARVVLASNQNLEALIAENKFRRDLFYRINRMRIQMPALRQRKEDIPLLARHFLALLEAKVGKGVQAIAPEAVRVLQGYHWPGNVRELKNEIERAYLHAEGHALELLDFSPEIAIAIESGENEGAPDPDTLEDLHKLVDALRASGGNLSKTAELLGVHRNTVRRWMQRYSFGRPRQARGQPEQT
ncbi:MAG TPA: sigma-54 dependent transcriptional regulator [Planctomycetota bacterium]|nr:sigma-54 dependent transcriptional regulator [Planctomycetota bacterium]